MLDNRLEELRRIIAEADDEIRRADEDILSLQRVRNAAVERRGLTTKLLQLFARPAETESRAEGSFEDAIEEMLKQNGGPMHIADLRSALIANGRAIPGRGTEANIIVRLARASKRFTRTARGVYGLSGGAEEVSAVRVNKRRRRKKRRNGSRRSEK